MIRTPRSLRSIAQPTNLPDAPLTVGAGLLAACLGAPGALAQTEPKQLPAMTVEAPTQARPKARVAAPRPVASRAPARATQAARVVRPRTSPVSNPAPVAAPAAPAASGAGQAADANPRATVGAPYKVDRPASAKMTERLLDTPRSIDVVPKEVLQDKGATSLRELARTTPGVTLGTGEGGNAFGDRIFIRGFDTRNDMYIDGVRDSGVTTRETFMVEQVDVVKGPSGSVSGRGASGGAINVVTKKPADQNFQHFSAEAGNAQQKRFTFDINQNFGKDWGVRVFGLAQDSDTPGRSSQVYDKRYGIGAAVQWKPSDAFKLTLDGYYMKFDQMPDWGIPFDPRTRRPFTESGLDRKSFYGIASRDFQRNEQGISTLTAEWNVSPLLVITSKLRAGRTLTDYVASKPGTPTLTNADPLLWTVSSTPASRYQVNTMVANQTDATWKFETFGLKHTLVTGVEVARERYSIDSYSGLTVECNPSCGTGTTSPVLNLFYPDSSGFSSANSPIRAYRPTKIGVDTAAVYVTDTVNWNDRVFLNAGIRLDRYEIGRTPFASAKLKHDENLVNWNAGLTYKILPNLAVYGSYATSSNPVGAEVDGGSEDYGALTAANAAFRAERNRMVEFGSKWETMNGKLLLTAALFQTEKDNARETVNGVLSDTASYRIRGFELGATGQITDQISIYGGYVHLDTRVTDSLIAASKGQKLANLAHDSFNLLVKYKYDDKLSFGGQATWKGEILGGTLAANYYAATTVVVGGQRVSVAEGYNKLPAGWRFDAFAEYAFTKNLSGKVQVNNIFNAKLYDGFYRSGTPFVYIAPGRSVTATLNAKF